MIEALFKRSHNWGAAGSLNGDHPWALLVDPTDLAQLLESLPHADEAGAAAGGIEDDVGERPAELVGELEAHRFFAFDAVRLFERRDIEPAHRLLAFGDDLAAVVDQAVYHPHVSALG